MPPNFDDFSGLPTEIANGSIVLLHLITLSHFSIDARSSLDGPFFRKEFQNIIFESYIPGVGPIKKGSLILPFPPNIPPFFAIVVEPDKVMSKSYISYDSYVTTT